MEREKPKGKRYDDKVNEALEKGVTSPAERAAIDQETDKRLGLLNRMHNLRKSLCHANCRHMLHREACKAMKKDIEYLKEIIL